MTATQTLAVVTAPNMSVTNTFSFPLGGVPTDGAAISATVRATDAASNSIAVARNFVVPDTRPPQLLTVNPTNGSLQQSLWRNAAVFDFDEALDAATITNRVIVTNNAGAPTPFTVSLANGNRQLRVTLARPLLAGVTYTNILLPGLADSASNGWQNISGVPVPGGGAEFAFTTAALLDVTPTNGTGVIAGQKLAVTVNYEPGLGANFFRFQINADAPMQVSAGADSVSAVLTMPLQAGEAVIGITASDTTAFNEPLTLPPLTVQVLPDTRPPELVAVSPTNDAPRQSLWLTRTFDFDEALDPTTLTNGTITLTNNAGAATPFSVGLANENQRVTVAPARPLLPGVTYTNTLPAGIADLSGNGWRNLGGVAVPSAGAPFTFTTAAMLGVSPTNGATVFAAQPVNVTVNFDPGLGANFFRFEITGSSPVTVSAGTSNASALLFAPASPTQAVINVTAAPTSSFAEALVLSPVVVNVAPLIGDLDGDGIPDDEDPDIDGDALTNTDEAVRGTDPRNPDHDGDRWRDGVEVEAGSDPLVSASVPVLFHVGVPEVGLILPTLLAQADLTNGITVAQPVVGLILPAFAEFADLTNGVVVAKPEVGLILPSFQFTEVADGLTVAQPEVGLILPVAPDFSSLTPGLTVAEPVVFLRLDVPTSGGAAPLSGLVLRLVQVEGAADIQALGGDSSTSGLWNVVLQWMGPNNGNYTMEASTNLHAWTPVRMEMLSAENGVFRVRCEVVAPEATFYRLRHSPAPFEK